VQRTYERDGFSAVGEKRDPQFDAVFGSPGTVRMWAEL